MDSLASLALATEEPKDDLLQRPPYRKREYIISQKMVKHILGMSIYQSIVLFFFVFAGDKFVAEDRVPKSRDSDSFNVLNDDLILQHPLYEEACDSRKLGAGVALKSDCVLDFGSPYVFAGMPKTFDGRVMYDFYKETTYSRHLTVVFNVFVLFQIFNMLAARKIHDEKNIFEGVFGNAMFVGVWVVICFGQYLIA